MPTTVRDLIKGSLKLIGAIATGQTPTAEEQADALLVLNEMLGNWSTENLTLFTQPREEFPLVAGTQSYTFGLTGNFNSARPLEVEMAFIKSGNTEYVLQVLTARQWAEISDKSTQSSSPTKIFVDMASPLATIHVWPVPSEVKTLVLHSKKALTKFTSVGANVEDLPPGYAKAMRYGLALELAPEYGTQPDTAIVIQANQSKANIKRMNIKPVYLGVDSALLGGKKANIFTGE
jgi:hypothetical protein